MYYNSPSDYNITYSDILHCDTSRQSYPFHNTTIGREIFASWRDLGHTIGRLTNGNLPTAPIDVGRERDFKHEHNKNPRREQNLKNDSISIQFNDDYQSKYVNQRTQNYHSISKDNERTFDNLNNIEKFPINDIKHLNKREDYELNNYNEHYLKKSNISPLNYNNGNANVPSSENQQSTSRHDQHNPSIAYHNPQHHHDTITSNYETGPHPELYQRDNREIIIRKTDAPTPYVETHLTQQPDNAQDNEVSIPLLNVVPLEHESGVTLEIRSDPLRMSVGNLSTYLF